MATSCKSSGKKKEEERIKQNGNNLHEKKELFAGHVYRIAPMRQDMHNSTNCSC